MLTITPKHDGPRLSTAPVGTGRGYLRPEFVRECPHDGLMRLLTVITNAPGRDAMDDQTLDQLALELARRQSPLCRVCDCGEPGVCDERCDWIDGARA